MPVGSRVENRRAAERGASVVPWLIMLVLIQAVGVFVVIPWMERSSGETYAAANFPDRYDAIAENIVAGNGYRVYADTSETLVRTPGYVLLLAGVFWITGKNLWAVQVLNLLLGGLGMYFLYRLALETGGSRRLGIVSVVLFALHPGVVLAASRGGVETTFTVALVILMFLIYRAIKSWKYVDFALVGAAFGWAMLVKSTVALAVPAVLAVAALRRGSRRRFSQLAGPIVLAAAVTMLVMSPWVIRNFRLTGAFVPTMTHGGFTAFHGLWIVKHTESREPFYKLIRDAVAEQKRLALATGALVKREGFFPQFYSARDEFDYYRTLGRLVRQEYRNDPRLLLHAVARNFIGFWIQGRTPQASALNAVIAVPFIAFVIWGTAIGLRSGLVICPVLLFSFVFIACHLPILGIARYCVPLVPLLAIPAAAVALRVAGMVDPRAGAELRYRITGS
jgi:4-amino-4-deoxy-L-arabinose transferase-like glycosyltransferase